jgi:predicted kinase
MHLVQINGPCGVGKTETARSLHEMLSGSLHINLDAVRTAIPPEDFTYNGSLDAVARMWHANVIGRQQARSALEVGQTVIVDSIKYQESWVKPWEDLGSRCGARVLEFCLTAPKDVVLARAAARGYKPGGRLSPEKVSRLYDQVTAYAQTRPNIIFVPTNDGRSTLDVAGVILQRILHNEINNE